jgi:hypothetical protein
MVSSTSSALAIGVLSGALVVAPGAPARTSAVSTVEMNQSLGADAAVCPVTRPNGKRVEGRSGGGNYGNDALVTGLWPDGTVVFKPGGPGFVLDDGALSMKFPWWRLRKGELTIEGRRLDGDAPPLRARIPCCYSTGFQATSLIFPTPGCWEVTGRVGDGSLTFVTRVQKSGEGPTRRSTSGLSNIRDGVSDGPRRR